MEMYNIQENPGESADVATKLPEKNKRSSNILFILILGCWLLLLYLYGGIKGPG